MCRTVHALLQVGICGIQMLVRVFMTVILMIENVIRMLLQTLYNFISFMLQMISLIPICLVFLATARLKCFMCGGGGPCPVARGGACDCLMSAVAIFILAMIFRATGTLDKIFFSLGYAKYRPPAYTRFVPTPGDITECSRNDTETTTEPLPTESTTELMEETESTTEYEYMYYDTDYLYYPYDYSRRTSTKKSTTSKPTRKAEPFKMSSEDYDYNDNASNNTDLKKPSKAEDEPIAVTPNVGDDSSPPDDNTLDNSKTPTMDQIKIATTTPEGFTGLKYRHRKLRKGKKIKFNNIPHNWTTVLYYLI